MRMRRSDRAPEAIPASALVEEIDRIFQRYWGGHYEVVKSFFGQPHPREQLVLWLEGQVRKEIQSIPGQAHRILEMYEKLDDEVDRGEMEREAYDMANEIEHYRLLADILELVTGQRRPRREFTGSKSPESQLLSEVRQRYRDHPSELVRSVGLYSPGGGAAFSAAGCLIGGGPVQRQLAEAFRIIHVQELRHYHEGRFGFDRIAAGAEPEDYPDALQHARELARAHFLERNALFSYPLSPARIAEIDAGNVTPYIPPLAG